MGRYDKALETFRDAMEEDLIDERPLARAGKDPIQWTSAFSGTIDAPLDSKGWQLYEE